MGIGLSTMRSSVMNMRYTISIALCCVSVSLTLVYLLFPTSEVSSSMPPQASMSTTTEPESTMQSMKSGTYSEMSPKQMQYILASPEYVSYQNFQNFEDNIFNVLSSDQKIPQALAKEYAEQVMRYSMEQRLTGEEALMIQAELISKSDMPEDKKVSALDRLLNTLQDSAKKAKPLSDERIVRYKQAEHDIVERVTNDSQLSPKQQEEKIGRELEIVRKQIYAQ
ncbi:hypothetical protein [Pseudomonas aeruginosa]|uniref:hypothetical protein n=1 Tax=Pseudomonas aeruginosa TaxID=287 RepID=UPI000F83EE81|nr:hypothetical protein [Pseudomonas aeruginosa]MBN5474516.1 hypothetical protein [Pseudomonas aeruginosa]RTT18295.1 hypothetical protein DY951_29320 [Pseudomonas aeruginosa]